MEVLEAIFAEEVTEILNLGERIDKVVEYVWGSGMKSNVPVLVSP